MVISSDRAIRFQISKQQESLNIWSFAIQGNDKFVANFRMNIILAFPNRTLKCKRQHKMSCNSLKWLKDKDNDYALPKDTLFD